jgi:hypothetical protein
MQELIDSIKRPNLRIMGIEEGEVKTTGTNNRERILEAVRKKKTNNIQR